MIPKFPILSLEEIAEIVDRWTKGRVTLNFVIMKGFTYSAYRIQELFHQDKVFIKINYVDTNSFTRSNGFVTAGEECVNDFAYRLMDMDYICAYRGKMSSMTVKG
jgi:adenine C2-methylase RlmN of 23S rRNA A2503 and tRNA A37